MTDHVEDRWIAMPAELRGEAAPLLRRRFDIGGAVRHTDLKICGLGYCEAWINGRRVGDRLLDPAQTDYEIRCLYTTYDVTGLVSTGTNVVGVILGNGFFHQVAVPEQYGWLGQKMSYGEPRLWLRIEIEYADGTRDTVCTDDGWQCAAGPILANNVYAGEIYDARLELPGWSEPPQPGNGEVRAGKQTWVPARIVPGPGGRLEEQRMPPVKATEFLRPVNVSRCGPGLYIVDLGQNISGWVRISVDAERGARIVLRFAETIDSQGRLDTASTGVFATSVEQIDTYICRGEGMETWEPRFTYHGFRYVEVSGWPERMGTPDGEQIVGVMVHTALGKAGEFSCSDARLNRLHRMALYTHRSNIHGIPEDCPARERCGWLGDAHLVCEYSLYNFHGETFWEKYLDDIETTRARFDGLPRNIAPGKRDAGRAKPDWMAAMILIPWYLYLYCGNRKVLERHWDGMRSVIEHFIALADGDLLSGGYGDWFDPGQGPQPSYTPEGLTTTLWFYECCRLMGRAAEVLNRPADGTEYSRRAHRIGESFRKEYYDAAGRSFGSQTADAMALHFDLVPCGAEADVARNLAGDVRRRGTAHTVGIMGMRYLFESLTRYGYGDVALDLMRQDAYPSFGDLISRGATTLWEYWGEPEIDRKCGARSLNHPMMGGFDNWFYNTLAGIEPDPERPGFEHIILKPHIIPGLEWVRAFHESPHGRIESSWRREADLHQIQWEVTVPPGSTATATTPLAGCTVELKAGTHLFREPVDAG